MPNKKDDGKDPIISRRSVFKIGESLAITLPKEWADQKNLKEKDEITVLGNADLRILSPDTIRKVYDKVSEIVKEPL